MMPSTSRVLRLSTVQLVIRCIICISITTMDNSLHSGIESGVLTRHRMERILSSLPIRTSEVDQSLHKGQSLNKG